jgi:hypothetical protein
LYHPTMFVNHSTPIKYFHEHSIGETADGGTWQLLSYFPKGW